MSDTSAMVLSAAWHCPVCKQSGRYHLAKCFVLTLAKELEELQTENQKLCDLLARARGYVEEPGSPGTIVETTQESADKSAALLTDIDQTLARS